MENKIGMRIKWLGCAAFEMDFGGATVVSDPWITENGATTLTWEDVEKCDYIAVTHTHFDHITDIPALVKKFDPRMFVGQMSAMPLMKYSDITPMKLYPMNPGLELDFDAFKIKALFGRHSMLGATYTAVEQRVGRWRAPWDTPLMQEMGILGGFEYINYLFTLPNGKTVLIWGNELTPDQCNMLREVKPDVAILQMTRNDPEQTAKLCAEMGCQVVMPHHIDFTKDYTHLAVALGEELKKYAPEARYIHPEYGKWYEL